MNYLHPSSKSARIFRRAPPPSPPDSDLATIRPKKLYIRLWIGCIHCFIDVGLANVVPISYAIDKVWPTIIAVELCVLDGMSWHVNRASLSITVFEAERSSNNLISSRRNRLTTDTRGIPIALARRSTMMVIQHSSRVAIAT